MEFYASSFENKENVQLSSELKIFYKLAEFNYSEQIALFDSNGELCYANKNLGNQ